MLRSPKPAKYLGGKGDRPANTQRFPPHVANENLLCCFGCDNAKLGRHKLHRSLFQSEIERFRARHRQVCRDQQNSVPNSKLEDQNEERTRKIPANWRQKQQVSPLQYEDGFWPESAGTEMRLTFNAFDFSASPEAFNDEPNWWRLMNFRAPMTSNSTILKRNCHWRLKACHTRSQLLQVRAL